MKASLAAWGLMAWIACAGAGASARSLAWTASLDALSMDPHASNVSFTTAFVGNVYETLARFDGQNVDLSKVDVQYAEAKPRLKGRLDSDDESGNQRTAMLNALMALQAQPIGFASGGFSDNEREDASAQLLMRAFNSTP